MARPIPIRSWFWDRVRGFIFVIVGVMIQFLDPSKKWNRALFFRFWFKEENFLPMFFYQLIPNIVLFILLTSATSLCIQATPIDCLNCSNPPAATANASSGVACPGAGTAILGTAPQGTTIAWFRDGALLTSTSGATYYATQAGNYHNVVTDTATGCSTYSNTIYLSQGYFPSTAGAINGNLAPCYGQLTDYYVHPVPNTTYYQWSVSPTGAATVVSGQGSSQICLNAHQATVQLTLTPYNECGVGNSSSRTIQFNTSSTCEYLSLSAHPKSPQEYEQVIFTNESKVTPRAGASFRWNFGEDAFPATATAKGPHTIVYHSEGPKNVLLEYVDKEGNVLSSETYEAYLEVTGARKTIVPNEANLRLYPNPTSDWITLVFDDEPSEISVHVLTTQGQIVLQTTWSAPKTEHLSLRALPSGIYLIYLTSEQGQQTLRVEKR